MPCTAAGIVAGVVRQQFVGHQRAIWRPPDYVGEGAPLVDPEVPAVSHKFGYLLFAAVGNCHQIIDR